MAATSAAARDQLNIHLTLQRTPGSGAFSCGSDSGLYGSNLGSDGPLATGGLIRCPFAMVRADATYVADAASTIGGGARPRRVATSRRVAARATT